MIIGEGEVMHKQTNRKVSFSSLHIYLPVNGISSGNTAPLNSASAPPRGPLLIKNQLNFLCSIILSYFTIICLDLCLKKKKYFFLMQWIQRPVLGIRKVGSDGDKKCSGGKWNIEWKKRVQGKKTALCPNVTPVVEKTLFNNWIGEWIGWWR